jgi:hypothetical protein
MIGNRPSDLEAGHRAGCVRGFLVHTDDSAASWTDVVAAVRTLVQ